MMASHSALNRAMFRVMLSSTRKIARAPRLRASRISAMTRSIGQVWKLRPRISMIEQKLQSSGRLDDVDGPSEQRIPVKHAGRPLRRKDLAGQMTHGPAQIAHEPVAASPVQTRDAAAVTAALDRPQQLAERDVALTAHDEIDPERRILVRFGREARVAPADDDPRLGAERSNERDDLVRRLALKCHHGKADAVGRFRGHKLVDGLRYGVLDQ